MKLASASTAPARRPPRRWPRRLLIGVAVLAGAAALGYWLIPAERVVDLALKPLGAALDLDIRRTGAVAWRLRGGPLLELHDVHIQDARTADAVLDARRVLVSLPWRTLRGNTAPLQLTRIELDAPQVNLPALLRWLDARPPGAGGTQIPAIRHGVQVIDGSVDGAGWRVQGIMLDMPQLAADARVRASVSARWQDADNRIDARLAIAMTRPAPGAGAAVVGTLEWRRDGLRIPLQLKLSGVPNPNAAGLHVSALRLDSSGELVRTPPAPPLAFTLALAGAADAGGGQIAIRARRLDFGGTAPLPVLHATGTASAGDALQLNLTGEMPRWPETWPQLPAPLGKSALPFAFSFDYNGAMDGSDPLALTLHQAHTRLDTRLRLPVLMAWLDAAAASPLPPLRGRVSTPLLEWSGVRLRGITLDMDADTPPR